jgi:hypothetical protein
MSRHLYGAIAERSRNQLGLIHRDQVLELGIGEKRLERLVRAGALERIEPSVLRVGGAPVSWEQLLLAGQLGLGPEAVVSHRAAAALWELDGIRPGHVEFTVPRGQRNRVAVGQVHSSLSLEAADVATLRPHRLTSVARTIVDIANGLTIRRLEAVVDGACRDRLTTEHELDERITALRRPRRSKLRTVLGHDGGTGRPHTWLERETLALFERADGPVPRMQVELTAGGQVARVDGCFDEHRLVVEVAGHRTHSTRRQRQADNERRLRLEQAGYRVLEFTYEDVTERPQYVLDVVYARLAVAH